MKNKDQLFKKRLVDLIQWYNPEYQFPKKTSRDILETLKNKIENSNCVSCNEESDTDDGYPNIFWTCKVCEKDMTIKNKCNHLRTKKHKLKVAERK